jgi:capsular polysaccharide export protein
VGAWRFPHYRSHRPWHPLAEYVVGMRRLPMKALQRQQTQARAKALWEGNTPYFLFPLQLDADTQIRFHAPAGGMRAAIGSVMQSFAACAPSDAKLVITEHPLDYSPLDLAQVVAMQTAALTLAGRVVFLRGGSPAALVNAARGLVTVNSTIGITALESSIPVITLGKAICNLAGLTCQLGLDAFWKQTMPPDAALFDAFRRVVAARTQINGGFHSDEGIGLAVAGALQRLQSQGAEPGQQRLPHPESPHAVALPPLDSVLVARATQA